MNRFREITIFLDGDTAGRTAATEIAQRLVRHAWVRVVDLPDGTQPDQLSPEDLSRLLPN